MIKKTAKGYAVDLRPNGREGRRFRKTFTTAAEARAYEHHIIAKHKNSEEWQKPKKDTRKLSELIDTWYKLHGQQLKSGHKRLTELNKAVADRKNIME